MKHCWLLVSVLIIIYSFVMPKLFTFPFDSVSFEKEEHTSNDNPLLFVSFYYLTLQISSQQLNRRFKETCFVCCFLWRQPSLVFRLRFTLLSVCLSVCGTLTDARVKQCCLSRFLYEERCRLLTLTATLGFVLIKIVSK